MELLPQSIEEYVANDDPVRAYDAFIDALDFDALGIEVNPHKVGNAEYNPKSMLKLLIYGYSYGIRSSRKLERATYHNISFIWLVGGLKPDHKTIAEFRRKNRGAVKKVLRECARMCLKLDLIAGNVLFVDGTKIRANAAWKESHTREWYEEQLSKVGQRIEGLLKECEEIDRQEEGHDSYVRMKEELAEKERLQGKIEEIVKEFEVSGRKRVNQTDPDCAVMKGSQGSYASYNVQSVVDDGHGLIVHADAVKEVTDFHQFARQIDQANEVLEKPCRVACGDAGYTDIEELRKIDAQGIKVVVPSRRQASHKPQKPLGKRAFRYDEGKDCYYCPQGYRLEYMAKEKSKNRKRYKIVESNLCVTCVHFGQCTTDVRGRRMTRLFREELRERFETQYEEEASQMIYKRRKARVEHPFGHIKRNLKADAFMLRGREGVQAETSLLATCYNIVRMITLSGGVPGLIQRLMMKTATV
jgi:transposase